VYGASDKDLVHQLQRGDLDALGALYDRHHQRVYRTALGITNDPEAAADLLQDVFLRVYRFARRIDPDRPLEPWLYRVTANLAYTWLKRRKRWYRYLVEVGEWLARELGPGPQRQLELDEEAAKTRKAVAALPVSQRMVVVLYYLNDLSIEEIAGILDIPEGTVKSRLYYARSTLKKRLLLQDDRLPQVNYELS
jgi:RNA polymerase sigma-70 factor (ECF subfamily)